MTARRPASIGEARFRRSVMAASLTRPATAIVTTVARNPSHGIVRKHGRGRTSHANLLWEKSMPFAKSSRYHRSRSQIEPARQTSQRVVQDPNSGDERALVIPLPHGREPARPAAMTMSAMTVKAVIRVSHFAEHTLPNLMVAVFSWIITETLAGCTAYAESLYPIPPAPEAVEAAPDETPRRRTADRLSLVSIHARLGVVNGEQPTLAPTLDHDQTDADTFVQPERQPGAIWRRCSSLGIFIAACALRIRRARARRRAIAELRGLDDRTLRDIGLSASDIEYIVWRDMERE
jgi:uncharacterized protein YjiS (DUF1127 family)